MRRGTTIIIPPIIDWKVLMEKLKVSLKSFLFDEFFGRFFDVIRSLRIERINNMVKELLIKYKHDYECECETSYASCLSPFTFKLFLNELAYMKAKVDSENYSNSSFHSCTCQFDRNFQLPCLHLFSIRQELSLNLFEITLCHSRWSREHVNNFLSHELTPVIVSESMKTITIKNNDTYKFDSYSKRLQHAHFFTKKLA